MSRLKRVVILTAVIAVAILIAVVIIGGGLLLLDGYAGIVNRVFYTDFSRSEIAAISIGMLLLVGLVVWAFKLFKFMARF